MGSVGPLLARGMARAGARDGSDAAGARGDHQPGGAAAGLAAARRHGPLAQAGGSAGPGAGVGDDLRRGVAQAAAQRGGVVARVGAADVRSEPVRQRDRSGACGATPARRGCDDGRGTRGDGHGLARALCHQPARHAVRLLRRDGRNGRGDVPADSGAPRRHPPGRWKTCSRSTSGPTMRPARSCAWTKRPNNWCRRRGRPRPLAPGHPRTVDYEYERNGAANLFMLFEGWRGAGRGTSPPAARPATMRASSRVSRRALPDGNQSFVQTTSTRTCRRRCTRPSQRRKPAGCSRSWSTTTRPSTGAGSTWRRRN